MEFKIKYEDIIANVEEEVSREGAQAYSAEGVSLYDGIRMVSRDDAKKKRLISEALVPVRTLTNRLVRHVAVVADTEEEATSYYFELEMSPRREAGKGESLKTLFRSLVVNIVLNRYFASKNLTDLASKYDAQALSDVQTIAKLLYEKLPPVYPAIV